MPVRYACSGAPLGCRKARHWRKKSVLQRRTTFDLSISRFLLNSSSAVAFLTGSRASPNKVRENRRRIREENREQRDTTKKSQALRKDDDD
ncbi:unnamed protein product [Lasius platythorax]|uniref:Uncharacterized protein n=1 Tax=Lasius platythorax TaxID=488582 RepID=A0AAV2P656_9HYME